MIDVTDCLHNAMADTELKRQLKIKTGVLKRTMKEYAMYHKEQEQQEAKIAKMKTEEKCEYDIRKQEEVLSETEMMIPDTRGRLERGIADLEELLEDEETVEMGDVEEVVAARDVIMQTKVVLRQVGEDAPEPEPEA